ncbi:ADP-dependent NAD(P)H-hydrate dehydratase [Sphingomonas sp. F9_3S_D5_B_2]
MSRGTPLDRTALEQHPLPAVVDGDKETKGKILIVAGSREVPGAALLAAMGAMRAGAGKLRIATVESIAPHLGIAMPEAMVIGLAETHGGFGSSSVESLAEQAAHVDAVIAGPGMTQGEVCRKIVATLVASDAALALDAALLHALEPRSTPARTTLPVLLPHAGELASLLDCDSDEVDREPIRCGLRAAELYHAIVVVKGVVSYVVTPDGSCWTYEGGAPGLGVSGSGDVLAGIVGGLLARGAEPLTALLWSVWLHGEAGARLGVKVGPIGFLARQIADEVPGLLPR